MSTATVAAGDFLTLHYRLIGPNGDAVVDTFAEHPATVTLGTGELAPALEARLLGLVEGSRCRFDLAPGEAFGTHNPELLQRVSRSLLVAHGDPDEVYTPGDVITFPTPTGEGHYAGRVVEAAADWVLFDFNHPLAGAPVGFEVELIGVLR